MNIRTRILNFGIDSLLFLLIALLIGAIVKNHISEDTFKVGMIVFYYLYYFLSEYLTGRTLGKYITNTSVIDASTGEQPAIYKILLRTLLRMFPLDFLSYLLSTQGIHDHFSKTALKYN